MSLAVISCLCLLTLCQSKYIEVNNKGNDSSVCCIEGVCLCGSLVKALFHIENNTMINITSSVSLHNVTHTGPETLNNITVIGSGITVACNNTGSFTCRFCNNVTIQGITWDQCGDPRHPNVTHAVGFRIAINVSILQCTFQHSKVCFGVFLLLSSGFVEIQDCNFLFNMNTNVSLCMVNSTVFFGSLLIMDAENSTMQNATIIIIRTLFYHNGPTTCNCTTDQLDIINSPKSLSASLICLLTEQEVVKLYVENLTVSTSFGLGGIIWFDEISNSVVKFINVTFYNNSNGGVVVRISGTYVETFFLSNSCYYMHNTNGSLKLDISVGFAYIVLYRLTVNGSKGTFFDSTHFLNRNNIGQGSGIKISSFSLFNIINMSFCNIHNNDGNSIVFVEERSVFRIIQVASIGSCNFTNNTGSALHLSNCTVQFRGNMLFNNNLAERSAAVYVQQGSQIAIMENSVVKFIGNTATQQGGAIFIELPFSYPHNGTACVYCFGKHFNCIIYQ